VKARHRDLNTKRWSAGNWGALLTDQNTLHRVDCQEEAALKAPLGQTSGTDAASTQRWRDADFALACPSLHPDLEPPSARPPVDATEDFNNTACPPVGDLGPEDLAGDVINRPRHR